MDCWKAIESMVDVDDGTAVSRLQGAARVLEDLFFRFMNEQIIKNAKTARVGPIPSISGKINGYLQTKTYQSLVTPEQYN
jgi:hypothetical protein